MKWSKFGGAGKPCQDQHSNWYIDRGQVNARIGRNRIAKHLSPDQIAEAQRLAREWMEEHGE